MQTTVGIVSMRMIAMSAGSAATCHSIAA